ncbi:MAG: BamA/TamA family outer membrane protein [Candidatus Zixiibacteriota bacterium]
MGATTAPAIETRYKDYKRTTGREAYFEVGFNKKKISVTVFQEEKDSTLYFDRKHISRRESQVSLGNSVWFDHDRLVFEGKSYLYDEIADIRIMDAYDWVTITFFTLTDAPSRAKRVKQGNRIAFSDDLVVEEDEFVRGVLLSITGNIEVYGEVNKDVVSLFGDVYLGPGAVARGDLASVTGRIDVAKDASVYGEVYSVKDYRAKRRRRFYRKEKAISFSGSFRYNRVDGATPYASLRFDDHNSLLPSFWAVGGYALESERWRYDIGLEQTIWRSRPLAIGGSFYRRLASDDDWLLTDKENLVFTLLVTEDFKDYYEAEGGSVYLVFKPWHTTTLETRYRLEQTKWLDAHPQLWSLFGGDKRFMPNFNSVRPVFRNHGIAEIDTTQNGYLSSRIEFDTRSEDDPFDKSAWHFTGDIQWSHPDLNSDFDYHRYTLNLRRYQKIHRRVMLLLRGMFGNSDGYLPMYKRFYLGGLGTMYGYKHKEFMGTSFWLANVEYRIDFPRTDLAASIFWDGGQIANETRLSRNVEMKHSLGIGVFLGDDMRINISKRLDRSFDDAPKIYVRFDHVF